MSALYTLLPSAGRQAQLLWRSLVGQVHSLTKSGNRVIHRSLPGCSNGKCLQGEGNSRHVRPIPWPSERWRTRRRINAGHGGRLHGRKRAQGHVQPRCRGGGGVGRGQGCRLRHRSGGGPTASRDAHGPGRLSAAQRTCARRAGWPNRRTGGRVGPTAARRGASNRAARWRQQPLTCRRSRSRRAGTITRGSSPACRTPEVAARGRRAQLGAVGGAGGQAPSRPCDPCGRTVLLSHVTPFAFINSVIATLPALTRPQIPEDTEADCHL